MSFAHALMEPSQVPLSQLRGHLPSYLEAFQITILGGSGLSDPRFSRAAAIGRDMPRQSHSPTDAGLLAMDPSDHTRLRSLISRAFTARRGEALRPYVRLRAAVASRVALPPVDASSQDVLATQRLPTRVDQRQVHRHRNDVGDSVIMAERARAWPHDRSRYLRRTTRTPRSPPALAPASVVPVGIHREFAVGGIPPSQQRAGSEAQTAGR